MRTDRGGFVSEVNKAVFLDRDGTINVEKNYLYRIEDFEFITGAIEGMKLLTEAGFLLIVITNQSGIARGYYTEEDYNILNSYMLKECEKNGIDIADSLYCPHLPEAKVDKYRRECDCRKPKTGLFREAVEKHDIDLMQSFAIGDRMRDLSICDSTGCRGYLIDTDNEVDLPKSIKRVNSLYDAATDILRIVKR